MKLQYLAIIFVMIIVPIVLTTSLYAATQIDTIKLQTKYNAKLTDATYDAVKAFQINTVNNRYSSIANSKIRDIEAAVSTFYNVLSSTEEAQRVDLEPYVPALVFTMYDGYYIYSRYDNAITNNITAENPIDLTIHNDSELNGDAFTDTGLKPYVYYSCRYDPVGDRDFIVCYTLDNAITVYGMLPEVARTINFRNEIIYSGLSTGTPKYKTLSGYLINPNDVVINPNTIGDYYGNQSNPIDWSLTYKGETIVPERLTEHLLFADGNYGDYDYVEYDGNKYYYDFNYSNPSNNTKYFTYNNYVKSYVTNTYGNTEVINYLSIRTDGGILYSTNAIEYYIEARDFSSRINIMADGVTQADSVMTIVEQDPETGVTTYEKRGQEIGFTVDTDDDEIFVTNNDNDPLLSNSTFDENRMQVIRKSIEANLRIAIANQQRYANFNYQYSLPEISEINWEKITNNVSVISFLQGIGIGNKIYNNYCVVTNDDNEEVVNKDNIYIITGNDGESKEYHLPGCTELINDSSINIQGVAYSNLSFIRQTVRISEGNYWYFYPQTRGEGKIDSPGRIENITACYHCIVNASNVHSPDEIIRGRLIGKNEDWEDIVLADIDEGRGTSDLRIRLGTIRRLYLRALGRARHDLYVVNMNNFNN